MYTLPERAPVDATTFAEWVAPARLAMTRLARRLAPAADPEDVVQDALANAWRKRAQFDPERGTPTTWLLAIVADQARTSRRSRLRRLRVVHEDAPLPDVPAPPESGDLDLERAILRLPERQQLAVHLHYFLGLTVEQSAQVMSCASGTVKSTLFDARTKLRTILGDDDD